MEVDEDVCVEFSVKDAELAEFNKYDFEDEPEHETCEISEEHITASLKSKDDKSYSSIILMKNKNDLTNEQNVLKQTNNDQNKSLYENSKCKERRNGKCKKSDESTGNGNFKVKNFSKRRATSTITAKPVLYNKNDNVFKPNAIKEITDKVVKAKQCIEEKLNASKLSVSVSKYSSSDTPEQNKAIHNIQHDVALTGTNFSVPSLNVENVLYPPGEPEWNKDHDMQHDVAMAATNFSGPSLNVENVLYPPGEPEWNKNVDNTAAYSSEELRKCESTTVQWQPSASQPYQHGNYSASVGSYNDPAKQQVPTFEYGNQSAGYYNCPPILQSYHQPTHYYDNQILTQNSNYSQHSQVASNVTSYVSADFNASYSSDGACNLQERFANILPANPVYSIAAGVPNKVITHPLLPSTQKPVILAVPVTGAEGFPKNKEFSTTSTNLSPSTIGEESSNDSNIVTSKTYTRTKKLTGEVSVFVNNIYLNVKMSTFKKVLQTLGRLLQFVVNMKKPDDISSSCKATFSNIETAFRAVRILSKLTICHQKLLVTYDDNTADYNYYSKSDVLRDKYLMNIIFKIFTHDNPKLLLRWDDDGDSHKKETLQKCTATSISKCNPSTSNSQQSSCGGSLGSTFYRSQPSNKKRSRFYQDNNDKYGHHDDNYDRKSKNLSSCSNSLKADHSKSKFEENKNMLQKCISSNNTTKSSVSSKTTKNANENQLHTKKDITVSDDEVDIHGFTAIKIKPKKSIHLNLNSCTEKEANVPTISNLDQLNIKIVGGMKNLSKITVNAINDVFMGSTEPMFYKGWLFSIPNEKHALLLHKCLNQCRLLDDILQVDFTNGKVPDVKYCEEDYMLFKHETEKALNLHNIIVEQLIRAELKKYVDFFNFKLEPCTEIDCSNTSCHHYHSRKDKRRDPRQYFYRYVKCPEVWMNQPCPRGDMCELCHSEVEFLLHPTVFLSSVCPQGVQCSSSMCGHVHPGSPDVFYHNSWKDLYVEGLHNTVLYIAGAIRNLHKLDDDRIAGAQVLAIVANATIAVEASKLLKDVARRHGIKISTITTGREDPSGCHLIIGNPSSLLALLFKKGTSYLKGLRAFIVEDISSMIEHKAQKVVLLKLTQLIMKVKENPDTLNKVLIAKDVFQKHVAFVEGVLSTHLSVVRNVKEADNAKLDILENENESFGKKNHSIKEDICQKEKISECSKLILANRHFPKDTDVQKYSVEGMLQTAKQSNVKMSVITVEESESVKSKFKRGRTDEVNNVEDFKANKARRLQGSPLKHIDHDLQSNVQHHAKKDDILTPQMFLAEEKFLRKEFENEYRVYLDVPEMHPLYDDMFNQFLKQQKNKYGKASSYCEEDWISYWQAEVRILKECEWKERKKSLIEKYKRVLAPRKALELTNTLDQFTLVKSVDQPSASHRGNKETSVFIPKTESLPLPDGNAEHDICVSYDVLEKLHGRLGLLGLALVQLIKMIREAGSTSRKAVDILLQEDNVVLQKLCIDKLKKELKGAPPQLSDTLSTGLFHAEKLFKYAPEQIRKLEKLETGPKEEEFCGLNLIKIAAATEGKSASFVANFIKCTLDFQGKTASKDDLEKLFLKVSSIHLDMPLMKEKSLDISSTEPAKDIIQKTSNSKEQNNLKSMPSVTASKPAKRSAHGIDDGKPESVESACQSLNNKANQFLIPEFNRSTFKGCDLKKSSYQSPSVPDQTKSSVTPEHSLATDKKCDFEKSSYQFPSVPDQTKSSVIPELNRTTDKKCDFEKFSYQGHPVPDQTKANSSFDSANISLASILSLNTSAETLKNILKNCANKSRSDVLPQNSAQKSCDDHLTQADANSCSKISTINNNPNVTVPGNGSFYASAQQRTDVNNHRSVPAPAPVPLPHLNAVHSLRSDYAVDHRKTSGTIEKLSGSFDYSEEPTTSSNSLSSVASAHFALSFSHNFPEKPGGSYGSCSNSSSSNAHSYDYSNRSTWFLDKVKSIVNNPDLTLSVFNKKLATILQDKPTSYKFSKEDLIMVKELQTLGRLNLDESLFIATLKGKFLGLV